ncbi:hypothetical protein [Aurantimonas endophytica]|uniref:Uncharacterized protein n=1 Tax=Aurantimonas endophytica TaxID=1522175 RepID=A0A7W6H9H2_9HYPH|nr:hypothetical protein [Aurantimonas endophytica]MBB4001002.1 hypothetical protein [Aurantimonas endophytica]MCO6403342.1 hypothetical protein [Aurantimonas endophytica]
MPSPWSRGAVQPHDDLASLLELANANTRENAITLLHMIAKETDPAVARSDSAQVIDELLRAIGYADVADAWNAVHRGWA